MIKVLFVCMGNICRSPMAEGAFNRAVANHFAENNENAILFEIDSAATTAYHIGNPPDPRACETALSRGVDITRQRARQVEVSDFDEFNYVVAMDKANLSDLLSIAPENCKAEVALLSSYSENPPRDEIPDPYYGGDKGFFHCFDLIDDAAKNLLNHIIENHKA